MTDGMSNMSNRVPWGDTLQFCESPDTAIISLESMFRADWRGGTRLVYDWAKDAEFEPFSAAVLLALNREAPKDTVCFVFRSLCDHRRSLFSQKSTAIAGWAEATAGLGPTGNPADDIALWMGAWDIAALDIRDVPPIDLHSTCLASIIRVLQDDAEGIRMCGEFLQRRSDPDDTECAVFAVSVLKDSLTVAENLYTTYKGLFGAVLDILYWPAMAKCVETRLKASLAGDRRDSGDGICERKTSSVIPQAASLTQGAPCAFST